MPRTSCPIRTWNSQSPCLAAMFRVECVLVAQSCPTLQDPMDCCPPGSSVHGVLQASILEWVAISSSRGSSRPRDQTCISCISCISRRFFTTSATWETLNMCLVTQSCPTLCDIMNCSPPGSSVHGDSPGKNIGVGCHAPLQGIFPTQGSNLHLTSPALADGFFTNSTTWEAHNTHIPK